MTFIMSFYIDMNSQGIGFWITKLSQSTLYKNYHPLTGLPPATQTHKGFNFLLLFLQFSCIYNYTIIPISHVSLLIVNTIRWKYKFYYFERQINTQCLFKIIKTAYNQHITIRKKEKKLNAFILKSLGCISSWHKKAALQLATWYIPML